MAGLGELVEPDLAFWTRPDINAWLANISDQVAAFARDVASIQSTLEGSAEGRRFLSDWREFKGDWGRWYNTYASPDLIRRALAVSQDLFANESRSYIRRYNALEERYRTLTGRAPTSAMELVESEAPSLARDINRGLMMWAVVGIVGIVGLGYLLSNYAKIRMIGGLAVNPRRSRRRNRRR
jgi:hypothetical protein